MRRIVAVGFASTHESGGLWCAHPECRPASTRLPDTLAYPFLLRCGGLACRRQTMRQLICAPAEAYARGDWTDYGQERGGYPGDVAVFGILCEIRAALRTRLGVWVHAWRKRLYETVRDWRMRNSRA